MAGERVDKWADFVPKKEDTWRIKVAQDLHFKNFYRALTEYFEDNEYKSIYGDTLYETFYDEKHQPDGVKEYRIRWRVYDIMYNTTYVVLKHTLDWQILKCVDKKIVVDGKKLTIQNMEVEITCNTYVLVNKKALMKKKLLLLLLILKQTLQ